MSEAQVNALNQLVSQKKQELVDMTTERDFFMHYDADSSNLVIYIWQMDARVEGPATTLYIGVTNESRQEIKSFRHDGPFGRLVWYFEVPFNWRITSDVLESLIRMALQQYAMGDQYKCSGDTARLLIEQCMMPMQLVQSSKNEAHLQMVLRASQNAARDELNK
jgi:hypothetical protein